MRRGGERPGVRARRGRSPRPAPRAATVSVRLDGHYVAQPACRDRPPFSFARSFREACPCCGGTMHSIGELRTEQLDIVPAQLRVRVTRRPRYACRSCEEAVVVAEAPARPIDGGMPTGALITHVLISKFCDSLPLYRQSQMLARQGIALDRSTLSNWVGTACWWLAPLYDLVVSTVLSSGKVFADDTTLPVLDPGRGRTKTGRLWCYAVDDRPWFGPSHPAAAYVYSEDRKGIRPAGHLASFQGVLQVDGYAGFKRLAGDAPTVPFNWPSAGCTCGGPSTSSMRPRDRRSRPNCWPAWPVYMRLRLRYVAIPPNTDDRCGAHEVGRSSKHCMIGCTISCRGSLARPISPRPCATRYGIGLVWWPSSTTVASRWTRTRSNGSSGLLPSHARTRCSLARTAGPVIGQSR